MHNKDGEDRKEGIIRLRSLSSLDAMILIEVVNVRIEVQGEDVFLPLNAAARWPSIERRVEEPARRTKVKGRGYGIVPRL